MKKLKLIKYGLICLIAIMIIGVLFLLNKSYAFFNYTKESNKINTASASGIDAKIISGENNLEINNSNKANLIVSIIFCIVVYFTSL